MTPATLSSESTDRADLCGEERSRLRLCVLFRDVTDEELEVVCQRMTVEKFAAREDILDEGQVRQGLWILIRGRCEVLKCGNGDQENRLAVLEAGSVFGEMSFLEAVPHSATVRALTDVCTLRLSREAFDELQQNHPVIVDKLTCNMVRILADRLRRMDEWTCELVVHNCGERQHKEWQEFRAKLYSGLEF